VRLSEASAKIRLSDKVTRRDSQRAIDLLKSSMQEVAFDTETGQFDIDRIATGITATQRTHIAAIRRILETLTEKLGKLVPLSDVLREAEAEGIERGKTEEIIENLRRKGDIMEPRPGFISKL
jgi:replicative DNA helicase Mcm